jgi:hypothetical protein
VPSQKWWWRSWPRSWGQCAGKDLVLLLQEWSGERLPSDGGRLGGDIKHLNPSSVDEPGVRQGHAPQPCPRQETRCGSKWPPFWKHHNPLLSGVSSLPIQNIIIFTALQNVKIQHSRFPWVSLLSRISQKREIL